MSTRRRRRGRGPRRRSVHCASPGPRRAPRRPCSTAGRPGTDTLSTHGLMRAGVLQLSRWGLLTRSWRRARRPSGVRPSTTPTGRGRRPDQAARRSRRPVRAPATPARPDPRRGRRGGRRRGTATSGGHRSAASRRGRSGAGGPPAASGGAHGAPGRPRGRRRRCPVHGGRAGRSAVMHRGRYAGAVLYRYVEVWTADGYEWAYGGGAAAGVIPTNDGQTCVFVGHRAARLRDCGGGACERALRGAPRHGRPGPSTGRMAAATSTGCTAGPDCPATSAGPSAWMGAGGRRGLLQGPDHHPRDDRRTARRRTARRAVFAHLLAGTPRRWRWPLPGPPRPALAGAVGGHRTGRGVRLGHRPASATSSVGSAPRWPTRSTTSTASPRLPPLLRTIRGIRGRASCYVLRPLSYDWRAGRWLRGRRKGCRPRATHGAQRYHARGWEVRWASTSTFSAGSRFPSTAGPSPPRHLPGATPRRW